MGAYLIDGHGGHRGPDVSFLSLVCVCMQCIYNIHDIVKVWWLARKGKKLADKT